MSSNTYTDFENNSSFHGSSIRDIGPQLIILQLNVVGLSRNKSSYLAWLLLEFKVDIVLLVLQEIHIPDKEQLHYREIIDGYKLSSAIYHKHYGIITLYEIISLTQVTYTQGWMSSVITIYMDGINVLNIYKPSNER